MNEKERIKTHAFEPVKRMLKDRNGEESEFEFKPLTNKDWIDFMYVSIDIEENKGAFLTKEQMTILASLSIKMIKSSYPEWSDEEVDEFATFHLTELLPLMQEIHTKPQETNPAAEKAKEMREKKKDGQ